MVGFGIKKKYYIVKALKTPNSDIKYLNYIVKIMKNILRKRFQIKKNTVLTSQFNSHVTYPRRTRHEFHTILLFFTTLVYVLQILNCECEHIENMMSK